MLTLKQKKLLDYIVQYCSSNKIYPTFDEMRIILILSLSPESINYYQVLRIRELLNVYLIKHEL